MKRAVTDLARLPHQWPTHCHSPEFWEHLGRAVASFGFLEDALRKTIFAYTGTTPVAPENAEFAVNEWAKKLESIMTMQLWNLAKEFEEAALANPKNSTENISELVGAIKRASGLRNVLCHGSWMVPDKEGQSLPHFTKRDHATRELVQFEARVNVAFLVQVQAHVAELICSVIDTITHMGYQFPGGAGPGKKIWDSGSK